MRITEKTHVWAASKTIIFPSGCMLHGRENLPTFMKLACWNIIVSPCQFVYFITQLSPQLTMF